jgi:1-acyl-sn-glycerol-3-phosphate acyltransferase
MKQNLFRFYVKTALFLIITIALAPFYIFVLFIFYARRQSIGAKLVQFYSKLCLLIFRVEVEQDGDFLTPEKKKRILIISNHTSFLDIFVLSALSGSLFVSKKEVGDYPIIGQIARLAGVIFFERASSRERLRVLNTITDKCSDRILAVFPQGTTSGIEEPLPFHRGIFKTVELNTDISLLPVTLYYKESSEIAWSKPQSLKENAIRVCSQQKIHAKIILHDFITINDYKGKTSSQICKIVEQTVLLPLRGC